MKRRTVITGQGFFQGRGEGSIDHGVLILATGGKEVTPEGYLYGEDPRVMTQRQLEKMIHEGTED